MSCPGDLSEVGADGSVPDYLRAVCFDNAVCAEDEPRATCDLDVVAIVKKLSGGNSSTGDPVQPSWQVPTEAADNTPPVLGDIIFCRRRAPDVGEKCCVVIDQAIVEGRRVCGREYIMAFERLSTHEGACFLFRDDASKVLNYYCTAPL
jgi:hypothetical protein